MPKLPKKLSLGEETLAQHLTAYKISFRREVRLIADRQWRWDFIVADLAIEIHGGTWSRGAHSRGAGQVRDFTKQNAAVLAGYRPLTFTTEQVAAGEAVNVIVAALAA